MRLIIFHQESKRVFRGSRSQTSSFHHTFGGSADYAGLEAYPGEPPVHLLIRLNTADADVGVRLPTSDWLPMLCAIRYGACDLGYRVDSDGSVMILTQREVKAWDGFPYEEYPDKLPTSLISFEERPYDPTDPKHAMYFAGVFGYDALSPDQFTALARFAENLFPEDLFDWDSGEDYLRDGNPHPFSQGRPIEDCPDPSCPNHGRASSLRTFAIFEEGESEIRALWGPNCGSLQIIFQICPLCSAIRSTNQSD